jgi:hypothetical protein
LGASLCSFRLASCSEDAEVADELDGRPRAARPRAENLVPDAVAISADGDVLRKRPRFSNPTYDIPGFGWLVHDVTQNSLDVHCGLPGHHDARNPCRLNRTLKPGESPGQGRSLGSHTCPPMGT